MLRASFRSPQAVAHCNCCTNVTKADTVTYVPSVATADGNVNGSIRFGSTDSMSYVTSSSVYHFRAAA